MEQGKREEIKAVIANASNVFVASIDENGYPNIKAMFARMQVGVEVCTDHETKAMIWKDRDIMYYSKELMIRIIVYTNL